MRFIRRGAHVRGWVALLALVLLSTACGGDNDGDESKGKIVVGSTNFSEQEIVANLYALVLQQAGYEVEERFHLGSREIVLPALEQGEIDLYPEYVGTALEFLNGGAGEANSDTQATLEKLRAAFAEKDVTVLEPAPAQDRNALAVTKETADRLGLKTVSDLKAHASELVFGGPPECPQRPLCVQGYERVYDLVFRKFIPLDAAGPVTWAALEGGDIDVALMFSSQGIIADKGWVLLEEDAELQPAENITPVIRTSVLTDDIAALLNAVSAKLTTAEISEMNRKVDSEKAEPADVARAWLEQNGLLEKADA